MIQFPMMIRAQVNQIIGTVDFGAGSIVREIADRSQMTNIGVNGVAADPADFR